MAKIVDFFIELLFPSRCPWCGDVLGFAHSCPCEADIDTLRLPEGALPAPVLDEPWVLLDAWACYTYKEPVRGAILRMKFEDGRNLAVPIGEKMAAKFKAVQMDGLADCIVPVPVSAGTQRRRGYNQSALVAWELARHTGLSCLPNALAKTRETTAQSELDRAGRLKNVVDAYTADGEGIAGKRVLLVDDILTTGSTLNECAKTLLAAGAAECRALCIAATEAPKLHPGWREGADDTEKDDRALNTV